MRLFNFKKQDTEDRSWSDFVSFSTTGGSYTTSKAMLLSAVYRCVEVISDSIAQLPLEPYKVDAKGFKTKQLNVPIYKILNKTPNHLMTRFTFIKTLVASMLLKGNAYAYIERYSTGKVKRLRFIPAEQVVVKYDGEDIIYQTLGTNLPKVIYPENMLHFLNFSYDGILGVSTIEHARNTLALASDSESHAQGFFKGGANLAGILKLTTTATRDQKEKIKNAWHAAFNPISGQPNGVAILEGNMEYQPITVSPTDAQLLETRQFNVIDICRFFNVNPVKVFDLTHSSYSTVEATQLAFLTDTIAPLCEKMEQELERKLFPDENIDIKFDTNRLLRADKAAMASYYSQLVNLGAYTPNEVRRELDMPEIDGGDKALVQVNLQDLSAVNNINNGDTNITESANSGEPQD
jgi:HK97 family phage portal protein